MNLPVALTFVVSSGPCLYVGKSRVPHIWKYTKVELVTLLTYGPVTGAGGGSLESSQNSSRG